MSRLERFPSYVAAFVALGLLAIASPARADFDIVSFDAKAIDPSGAEETRAGARPFAHVVHFKTTVANTPRGDYPDGNVRDVSVDLPPGFVGDPGKVPTCEVALVAAVACPDATQIGMVTIYLRQGFGVNVYQTVPVYNVVPPKGAVADFAFNVTGVIPHIVSRVRPDGNGIRTTVTNSPSSLPFDGIKLILWGVPADPAHDPQRGAACALDADDPGCSGPAAGGGRSAGVAPVAFLINPTFCGGPLTTSVRMRSWEEPGRWVSASDTTASGMTGCEVLSFPASLDAEPSTRSASSPSGVTVDLDVPYNDSPDGRAVPTLRKADVLFPEGVSISPSSAGGLGACSDAQFGLGADSAVTCPDASKIGDVEVTSPALEQKLEGAVYVGSQASSDPGSGDMFRLFMHIESDEYGISIKQLGNLYPDEQTGQLRAVFDESPQLPFTNLRMELKTGPRASLVTPAGCGTYTTVAKLTPWAAPDAEPTVSESSFEITDCGDSGQFAPTLAAGAGSPFAGEFAPFRTTIRRTDGQQQIGGVSVDLPKGLLAKLKGVELCGSAAASGGSCPAASRVGSATVGAGPGSNPFYIQDQPVYLTDPYKGAPYGLAVHIHAKAGPFDLGTIRVRQALHIDPETTQARIVSDPLPQIQKGVPLHTRTIHIDVDRPDFTVNPTSCAAKQISATLTSTTGTRHIASNRFQLADCGELGFTPRLSMRLVGRKQMRSGGHPILRATLRQGSGQANIRRAKVTLPANVVLDSENTAGSGVVCDYDTSLRADCPAHTVIGKASLRTPLLNRPLSGPVYLVQGIRIGKTGNRIRTLPTLLVKLRGEVSINLRSATNVDSRDRLVSTFPTVPDARAGRFDIQINGGPKGILLVTENRRGRINLCNKPQRAQIAMVGHNQKRADYPIRVKTSCAKAFKAKRKR